MSFVSLWFWSWSWLEGWHELFFVKPTQPNEIFHIWKLLGLAKQMMQITIFNPFMHNVEKWPIILLRSCGVHTANFLKVSLTIFLYYARFFYKFSGNLLKFEIHWKLTENYRKYFIAWQISSFCGCLEIFRLSTEIRKETSKLNAGKNLSFKLSKLVSSKWIYNKTEIRYKFPY